MQKLGRWVRWQLFLAAAVRFVFRLLRWAVSCLPPALVVRAGARLGQVAALFMGKELRVARIQLEVAYRHVQRHPELAREIEAIRTGSLHLTELEPVLRALPRHYGEMIAELLLIESLLRGSGDTSGLLDSPYIRSNGENLVLRLLEQQHSVVALSAHLGNFELLAAYYARCGGRISTVGREANYPVINALIEELRRSYGVENIARSSRQSVAALRRVISEKRVLAVLIDQDTRTSHHFAPFFGMNAATPVSPIAFAVRYRLPIITTFIVRESPLRHVIHTEEVTYDRTSPDVVDTVLHSFNRRLEVLVAAYPEQWPWWHRRWRRRPVRGEGRAGLRSTSEYIGWLRESLDGKMID